MERLTAALGRLERKLYPHRIRPIHAHLEIHPLSAIGQEQGQSQLQNYWQLVVHELQEFERKKPRR
ncbi:MAG: hypothetical protein Q8P02_00895 [Candidatus Micrarchaeota archaeon]|nr:hypothetical protein [Candidatus Micrarchaeota archaeon]